MSNSSLKYEKTDFFQNNIASTKAVSEITQKSVESLACSFNFLRP